MAVKLQSHLYTYNGFRITVRDKGDGTPRVTVFDPHNPRGPALHETTSIDLAMNWCNCHRTTDELP